MPFGMLFGGWRFQRTTKIRGGSKRNRAVAKAKRASRRRNRRR